MPSTAVHSAITCSPSLLPVQGPPMTSSSFLHSAPFWLTTSVLVLGGVLSSRAAVVASGASSVPANTSRAMNSCAACHSSSGPTATRTNPPVTTLTVGSLVLAAGQQTP